MCCNLGTFAEKPKIMLLKDFFYRFRTEADCVEYFKTMRQSVGIVCPKCGCKEHKWIDSRKVFQCNHCGNWTSLTQGTVMSKSHVPLYSWFFTAHLMTSFKQVLSAKEIQHQLEMKYYPPAWLMMMKLRDIMGQRDAEYKLSGQVEMDISFFPTSTISSINGVKVLKSKKTAVLVIAESKPADDVLKGYFSNVANNKKVNASSTLKSKAVNTNVAKAVKYIKMFALPNQQFNAISPYVTKFIDEDTKVLTDGGHNLMGIKELVKEHEPHVETESDIHDVVKNVLPWVHIVTGECRSGIEAIHKEIDERFLQLYLNEYCWKFNRRFFRDSKEDKYDLFDHLIRNAARYTSGIKWRDYEDTYTVINKI